MRLNAENVLVVDDDSGAALSLVSALKLTLPEIRFHAASEPAKALELFSETSPNAVVLDLHLEERTGVESGFALQQRMLAADTTARIIVLTGHSSLEHGVRALNSGAANFLEKPADISHLAALLRDAVSQSELRRSFQSMSREREAQLASVLCGKSSAMQKVREAVAYAGQTSQPVLVLGATGSGKGLCAWAIHEFGRRRAAKFVRYQPTFGTADLVNSDLFGHAKGAFTGAQAERRGLLVEADGGTLFLDEIEELPTEIQVSLLGVLQDKRVRRVGSDMEVSSDFRLVCATNGDPQGGKLRSDFYHRIAHFSFTVPALAERKEDIEELVSATLQRLRDRESLNVFEVGAEVVSLLKEREWPGNVRELEAAVEGAAYRASFAGRSVIEEQDLLFRGIQDAGQGAGFHGKIESYKRALVEEALRASNGNQVRAAKALGIDRSSLRRILA